LKTTTTAHRCIVRIAKGFAIGASMLIPGVSGGTMAILLGVYDELISALSNLRARFGGNGLLLLQFLAGGSLGILLLSGPMLTALALWPKPVMFFFTGAILAGIPPIYRKVRVARIKPKNICVAAVGAAVAVATEYLPSGLFTPAPGGGFDPVACALLVGAGFVIAVALILPGISGSYVLLMFGMYDLTLAAVRNVNLPYLLPLAAGALVGAFSTAGLLDNLMRKRPQFIYMLIIGFMLGSVVQVFPGLPAGSGIPVCAAALLAGFGAVLWIGRFETREGQDTVKT
jgi:putative membrane protein